LNFSSLHSCREEDSLSDLPKELQAEIVSQITATPVQTLKIGRRRTYGDIRPGSKLVACPIIAICILPKGKLKEAIDNGRCAALIQINKLFNSIRDNFIHLNDANVAKLVGSFPFLAISSHQGINPIAY
jgi:hypothetical protein